MRRIHLRLEGRGDTPDVSLDDFVSELAALKSSLEHTDRALSGGRRSTEWVVVELSHSSPATVVVEGRGLSHEPWAREAQDLVLTEFTHALKTLARDEPLPTHFSSVAVGAFRALAAPAGANRLDAQVIVDGEIIDITPSIEVSAAKQIEKEVESEGRYKGLLEFLNIHGRKSEFRIYPPAGPNFVTCEFDPAMLSEAQAAVGANVSVDGTLVYRARQPFPHRIRVARILVSPRDDDLPGWQELRGLVPGLTGGRPAEEWVREARSE